MSIIEANKLTKYYGKARGIIDVSFSVDEGEIYGFIGPNGAGKSTTIRLFLSLIYPSGGSAIIFGKYCIQ
jgi:ABC-2 type transport system ATP-binding protein